jgi:hypothetical protein
MYSPLTICMHPVRRCRPQRIPEPVGKYTLLIQGRIVDTIRDVQSQVSSTGLEESIKLYYNTFSRTGNKDNKDEPIDLMGTRFITALTAGRHNFILRDMINLLTKEGYAYESGIRKISELLEAAREKPITELYSNRVHEKKVVYRDGEKEIIPTWDQMAHYDLRHIKKCLEEVGLASQYPGVATIITNMWEEMTDEDRQQRFIPSIYYKDTFRYNADYLFDRFGLVKARAVFARTQLNNIWRKVALDTESRFVWEFTSRLTDIKTAIQGVMAERTCFTTESEGFGICHPSAQQGDLIVTIPNAETPFIMRRWTDEGLMDAVRKGMLKEEDLFHRKGAEKQRREYLRLVGDCYVYEYMDDGEHAGKVDIKGIRIL